MYTDKTIVISPRLVASGRGAQTTTLGKQIDYLMAGSRFDDELRTMIENSYIANYDLDMHSTTDTQNLYYLATGFGDALRETNSEETYFYANATLANIESLFDDPNVRIITMDDLINEYAQEVTIYKGRSYYAGNIDKAWQTFDNLGLLDIINIQSNRRLALGAYLRPNDVEHYETYRELLAEVELLEEPGLPIYKGDLTLAMHYLTNIETLTWTFAGDTITASNGLVFDIVNDNVELALRQLFGVYLTEEYPQD